MDSVSKPVIDRVTDLLVSLWVFLPVFFVFMAYRYFEIQRLFADNLTMMDDEQRTIASVLIALVTIFTTMIFMVNSEKLDGILQTNWPWSKVVLVVQALLINVFFWRPWEAVSLSDQLFRWFVCVMLSSMDYGFAHLFKVLRAERQQINHLLGIDHLLKEKGKTLERLSETLKATEQRHQELSRVIKAHTCPHCKNIFPSPKSLNAHKGVCNERTDK